MLKKYPTLGCCGLDCGLCPSYYTDGPSRCPGCCGEDFVNKHPQCSILNCCVKKRNLEVCAECEAFPCPKFDTADEHDVITTSKRMMHNQYVIRESGLDNFIEQQGRRMDLLRSMLGSYNDGRSKTFYCLAAALLSLDHLAGALNEAEKEIGRSSVSEADLKGKARILKSILNRFAAAENEELKLREKRKP